jgi:hypothetical protein
LKFRITVRGEGTELRGYAEFALSEDLAAFAGAMKPFGVVIASPADADYDPFKEWNQ